MENSTSICIRFIASATLALAGTTSALAEEILTTPAEQTALAVTVYNHGAGLVKDRRTLTLPAGENALAFRGVSAKIRPETVVFVSRSDPQGLQVIEQNFDYDLLSPNSLLDAYLGKNVTLVTTNPASGEEKAEQATVLATPGKSGGTVLKIGDRIEAGTMGANRRLVFSGVPENFRDQPTLVMQLANQSAGEQEVELAYLTSGMSWEANYVAQLSADEKTLDLNGWVTLDNQSGARYENANLQLVAGDVNVVRERVEMMMADAPVMRGARASPEFAEEGLYDYHLYTLDRPTTLSNRQKKQIALLSAAGVGVEKRYLLRGNSWWYQSPQPTDERDIKIATQLRFDNSAANQLGKPLPKGVVRLYKNDSTGGAQFIGEDRIDHTAEGQTIRLSPGMAFDLTATRKQYGFRQATPRSKQVHKVEVGVEIVVDNAKDTAATVRIEEPIPGKWQVLEGDKPTERIGNTGVWLLDVPAKGNATVKFVLEAQI